MKDFLKMLLAVVCGLFLASILSMSLFVGCVAGLATVGSSKPVMPRSGVLRIDMSDFVLVERAASIPDFRAVAQGNSIPQLSLIDLLRAVESAATDESVKFIYLKTDGMNAGLAALEELRGALSHFRASGKAVVAYCENPSTGGYYLASVADRVIMNGNIGSGPQINGIATQMIFLGDLLEKLGVNVQLIRHGKYKSYGEMYVRNSPSKENLEQNKRMVTSMWNSLVEEICQSRSLDAKKLNSLIDNLELGNARDMVANGLADTLMTREELKLKLAALSAVEDFGRVSFIEIMDYVTLKVKNAGPALQNIAVLYADGEILDGDQPDNVQGDYLAVQIAKLRQDESVKAVVFRVNSPGGSVLASDKIRSEIDLLRAEKPVIASFGAYAASGGYWISNSCDKIYSDKTTLTGSIGVFGMIPDASKTLRDKLHIGVTTVGSSAHPAMGSIFSPLSESEKAYIQKSIEEIYAAFLENVSKGRGMSPEDVDEIAQGRVWTGTDALELGLVDEIGGLQDAIAYAASVAWEEEPGTWGIVLLPAELSTQESLLAMLGLADKREKDIFAGTAFEKLSQACRTWYGNSGQRVFARLPYGMTVEQ